MLIDQLLPTFEFRERHEIRVNTRFDHVYAAVLDADFSSNRIVRMLLGIRALPARLLGRARRKESSGPMTLRSAERFGFFIAGENPPVELVILIQGQFWKVEGGMECATREALVHPIPPGTARAAWNFSIRPTGLSSSILTTETRIHCADASARHRFRFYWTLVRPGSGIIRRMMLRTVRDLAESRAR